MKTKKNNKKTGTKISKELANIIKVATSVKGRKIIQNEIDNAIIADMIKLMNDTPHDE